MSKSKRWIPSVLCLLTIWLAVALVVRAISSAKPSGPKTLELLESIPASTASATDRRAWMALFASRLADLDLDSRHLVLMNPELRSAFLGMPAEDQSNFLEAIKPPSTPEFFEGTKTWSLGRYERLMKPSLLDLESIRTGSTEHFEAMLGQPSREEVNREGIDAFLKQRDPVSRFDALPFLERMQKHSQMGR